MLRRFVEPLGPPQQRRQHQPGVQVADVSPQQAFENLFRLIIVAFQVVIHRLAEGILLRAQGWRRPLDGDIALLDQTTAAIHAAAKAGHNILRILLPISSVQPKLTSNNTSNNAAAPRATAKPDQLPVQPYLGKAQAISRSTTASCAYPNSLLANEL